MMSSEPPATSAQANPALLTTFLTITEGWREVFPQVRSYSRAVRQALGGLLCAGRRTLTRIIWSGGREQKPWAAEYHLHSRVQWEAQELFEPIWRQALKLCPGSLIGVAIDDTKLKKTGRCIQQAFYQRDPLSPPFHVNLMLGLRFLQGALLIPATTACPRAGARALPVRFEEVSRVKKPGPKASVDEHARWKLAKKESSLSRRSISFMQAMRHSLDKNGGRTKSLIVIGDGSFCNRTCFGTPVERTQLLVRARKDAKLCHSAPAGQRRFYASEKFTPLSVRQDSDIPWQSTKLVYGAKKRKLRFKEVTNVYWQGGAKRRPLRLIVIAPTPYKKRKSSKLYYRDPAYLLTTDLHSPAKKLIQMYLDRWQIEVNHREEKDTLGIGQAQLWNRTSVPKQPVLAVAAYSALLLAGIIAFGRQRTDHYAALPAWRRNARRPSCLDLLARLRQEAHLHPDILDHLEFFPSHSQSVAAAAA